LLFLIKKGGKKNSVFLFSSDFGHQNPGSGLDPDPYPDSLEMPDPDSMNPDPQFWLENKEIHIVPEDSPLALAT
jgi:hypothetical protein